MGAGGKGGGGSKSTPNINVQPSPYEQTMADISQSYWQGTEPLRQQFYGDFQSFLKPGSTSYYPSRTYVPGAGGAGTSGTTNFNMPTVGDVSTNIRNLIQSGNMADIKGSESFFSQYGVDPYKYIGSGENFPWEGDIPKQVWQDMLPKMLSQQQGTGTQGGGSMVPGGGGQYISSGAYDPYKLPAFQPIYNLSRGGLEDQYRIAKQNIMAQTPEGGALSKAMADLERGRAYDVGALPAQISAPLISDLYNKAYGMATGAPQVSLAGLGAASAGATSRATSQAQLAQSNALAQQQMANQMWGGLGSGLGALGAAAILK